LLRSIFGFTTKFVVLPRGPNKQNFSKITLYELRLMMMMMMNCYHQSEMSVTYLCNETHSTEMQIQSSIQIKFKNSNSAFKYIQALLCALNAHRSQDTARHRHYRNGHHYSSNHFYLAYFNSPLIYYLLLFLNFYKFSPLCPHHYFPPNTLPILRLQSAFLACSPAAYWQAISIQPS